MTLIISTLRRYFLFQKVLFIKEWVVTASVSCSSQKKTESQLDEVVEEITREYPSCEEGLLKQILADRGINVQRMRLCDSIHRVDHEGVENRKKGRPRRRTYNVQGPFLQKIAYTFDPQLPFPAGSSQ